MTPHRIPHSYEICARSPDLVVDLGYVSDGPLVRMKWVLFILSFGTEMELRQAVLSGTDSYLS